jgi:metal-responsive CopG/Arc/MetJ family transcriptional regulator
VPRTIIDLRDEQLNRLDTLAERLQVSRAEAVRLAVDEFINTRSQRNESFGSWKGKTTVEAIDKKLQGRW